MINILKLFPIFLISAFMLLYLGACGKTIYKTEAPKDTKPRIENFDFDWEYTSCSKKWFNVYNFSVDFKDPDKEEYFDVTIRDQNYSTGIKRISNNGRAEGKISLGKEHRITLNIQDSKSIWIQIADPKRISNPLFKTVDLSKDLQQNDCEN